MAESQCPRVSGVKRGVEPATTDRAAPGLFVYHLVDSVVAHC